MTLFRVQRKQVAGIIAETQAGRGLELHQRADFASMSLTTMIEALRIALAVSLADDAYA